MAATRNTDYVEVPPIIQTEITGYMGAWVGTRRSKVYRVERWLGNVIKAYRDGKLVELTTLPARINLLSSVALGMFSPT